MVILEDTRQQPGKHKNITAYLDKTGIPWARQALYVGDYMIANDGSRAVDTKQDVLELIMDMHGDHDRFKNECKRAQEAQISLLVLIEEELPAEGLSGWKAPLNAKGEPLTRADPEALRKALITMTAKYGVRFRFCSSRSTGRVLVEYLVEGVMPK